VILAEDQVYTVFGTGPGRFWRDLGLVPPAPGQVVTVEGFTMDYHGLKRHLAARLIRGDRTVELRKPGDGSPAWR